MNSASNSVLHQDNTHKILLKACDMGELQGFVKKKIFFKKPPSEV